MIDARAVTVTVGRAGLLHDVDFAAGPGELVAVIGPNGAGKSTLLRVLAGDIAPTDGIVRWDGTPVDAIDVPSRALLRAAFAADAGTPVPFTARDVVAMGRHPHRRDPGNSASVDDRVVESALIRMDVAELANRTHSTLSSGERMRVNLARTLAQDAPVVLLDEPTTALDVRHEVMVMAEFAAEAGAGRTVVAVLHDLNTAARFATRIVAMRQGRAVADGVPGDVLNGDLLTRVFDHPMSVVPHPHGDGVVVLPGVATR